MDDNSEDEFEENFGELDDEIVPDLEAVHEELIENGSSQEQAAFMDPADSEQTTFEKTDSGFSDSAKQSRTTTYATN